MSQENVEIVRKAWQAYNDAGIDGYLDYIADDCVSEDVPELPDGAIYQGREGGRERERHFRETWGDWDWEPVEFIDAGDGVVVVVMTMRAHGRGSGTPVEVHGAFVYEVRGGKIVSDRAFTSRSQALEAAGLEE
jgi:ketosteroid isomerase-like protein